eukprot:PITA_06616
MYDMDRHKLTATYRFHKTIKGIGKFESVVVDEFKRYNWQIRSCYHKFVDYKEEKLAWIMALDVVFLLECLQFYVRHADESLHADLGSKAKAEERLSILLKLFCQELSPFGFDVPQNLNFYINERAHLLDVLYNAFVPLSNNQKPIRFEKDQNDAPYLVDMSPVTPIPIEEANGVTDRADMSTVTKVFNLLWKVVSSILTSLGLRGLNWRPTQFLTKSPLLPDLSMFKKLFDLLLQKGGSRIAEESSSEFIPPSCNQLTIPSVADFYFVGVKFSPTDTNTEVILRNLVAFEASIAPGALVFRRYIDFMNGIIDEIEDVKLLRESGIICNHLLSDREVSSLWNSLGKSVIVTNVVYLDKVIEDLNKYHSRKWKVVVVVFVNHYIFGSWKFLSLVAAAILLIVTCMQAYCSVYNCRTWVK